MNEIVCINKDETSLFLIIFSCNFFNKFVPEKYLELIEKNKSDELKELKNTIKNENNNDNSIYFNYTEDYRNLEIWRYKVLSINQKNLNRAAIKEGEEDINNEGICEILSSKFNDSKYLFSDRYKKYTIGLWMSWFSFNFVGYGLVFILPFFLNSWDEKNQHKNKQAEGLKVLMLSTLGEGSAGFLAYFLVDRPIFGRKNSLTIGQFIYSLFILMAFFIPLESKYLLILTISLARFSVKFAAAVIYPFTAEIYDTSIRTLGVASSSAIGRIGATLMPIISIKLFYYDIYYPFLLYFGVGMFGFIGALIIPFDTTGKHLDIVKSLL
jgi:hypothetical protein